MDFDYEDITGIYRFPSLQLLHSFPLKNLKGMPSATGVYIVYLPNNARPLYVGRSMNFFNRVRPNDNHKTLLEINLKYSEARVALLYWGWSFAPADFTSLEEHDSIKRAELNEFEIAAIRFYNPELNKRRE